MQRHAFQCAESIPALAPYYPFYPRVNSSRIQQAPLWSECTLSNQTSVPLSVFAASQPSLLIWNSPAVFTFIGTLAFLPPLLTQSCFSPKHVFFRTSGSQAACLLSELTGCPWVTSGHQPIPLPPSCSSCQCRILLCKVLSSPLSLYLECLRGLCFHHFTWKPISQSSRSHCLENFSYLPLKMFFS